MHTLPTTYTNYHIIDGLSTIAQKTYEPTQRTQLQTQNKKQGAKNGQSCIKTTKERIGIIDNA